MTLFKDASKRGLGKLFGVTGDGDFDRLDPSAGCVQTVQLLLLKATDVVAK